MSVDQFDQFELDPGWRERRHIADHLDLYPWFFRRCRIRILMYADGPVGFNGGGFVGLQRTLAALNTDPWYWVTFAVTTAHRGVDPSAQHQGATLDSFNLADDFDEVWLFGFDGPTAGYLSAAELSTLHGFMDTGGGVLVTGDHDNLGAGMAAAVKRAGKMRLWDPAAGAPTAGADRHDTLQAGGSQSDATPQPIRLKRYPTFNPFRRYPHPLLCGPAGPIDILPDHMHEGEAVAPTVLPPAEWPQTSGGFQPAPEAIAWGKVTSGNRTGWEFPVISVYDGHAAAAGRIVADSTWHHWFDINLLGFAPGSAEEEETYAYFRNVAVWLAPPALQRCMRRRMCWGALYLDPLVMVSPLLPVYVLGGYARDAFGKYAPQCFVYSWFIELIDIEVLRRLRDLDVRQVPGLDELADLVMGQVVRNLRERFPAEELPRQPPDEAEVDAAFDSAGEQAVAHVLERLADGQRILREALG